MILFQDKTREKHETAQAAPGGVIAAQATVSMTRLYIWSNESASKMSSQNQGGQPKILNYLQLIKPY